MSGEECTIVIPGEPIIQLTENGLEGFEVLCRLCANRSDHLISIYSEEGISNGLAEKMNMYLPVKVAKSDTLPLQCCYQCASTVLTWHELVVASVETDRRLRNIQDEVEKQLAVHVEPGPSQVDLEKSENERLTKQEPTTKEDDSLTFTSTANSAGLDDVHATNGDSRYCQLCLLKFPTKATFTEHNKSVHASLTCQKCHKVFANHNDLAGHTKCCSLNESSDSFNGDIKQEELDISEDEQPVLKQSCDEFNEESYDSETDVKVHTSAKGKRNRRKKSEIIAEHFCDICAKGFTRRHDMKKHRSKQHASVPELVKTETPVTLQNKKNVELLRKSKVMNGDGKQVYKCDTCGKLIHHSYDFVRHQTIHTGVRPYFCHICGKSYRMSSTLNRHIKELHYRIKKFACDQCGRKFAARAALEDHKNIHTNARPFVCDVCGKAFKQKSSLYIHKLFHADNFRFSCAVCGKQYRRARDLKVHSWLHTGHRPYACDICGSMFRLSQDLKRHARVHTKGSVECVCPECGASFSQIRYLNNHRKIHEDGSETRVQFDENG